MPVFRDYLHVLRKRWLTVAVVTVVALATAVAASLATTPQYEATTRLFFAVQTGESVSDLAQGSSFTERQMSSYARVTTSPLVLEPVIDGLGLGTTPRELARDVRSTVPVNTVILEITVTRPDPEDAARVANAIGAQLSTSVADLSPERPDGSQAVLATTLAAAEVPTAPAAPDLRVDATLGLLAGLALGVGLAMVRHGLDTRIRSARELAEVTDRPVLGTIVLDPGAPAHPVVMQDSPQSPRAESIRRLRTNLRFVDAGKAPRSIVVTSSLPSEGKTTTAVDLAIALADAGSRVILVDADLRRPSVASFTGLEGGVGLTTVLIGQAEVADVVQPWGDRSLDVLPSGEIPPNPSELLGSHAMAALLAHLTQVYDVVLLDTAPLLPVTDAAVLAKVADGTLMVVGTDLIHRAELGTALDSLDSVGAHVLGIVLNKVPSGESGTYGYEQYGYGVAEVAQSGSEARREVVGVGTR